MPEILGGAPVRSHLTALLVRLDREQPGADGTWEDFYAARIVAELGVGWPGAPGTRARSEAAA